MSSAQITRPAAVGVEPGPLARAPEIGAGFAIGVVHTLWLFQLFEPDWFLASFGGGAVLKRIPTLLLLPLLLVLLQYFRGQAIYWPWIAFIAAHVVMLPFSPNRGMSMSAFKALYHAYLILAATACLVGSPARGVTLLKMFLLCFLWFAPQGLPGGNVSWHANLGNPDAYGPWMAIGMGFSYYMGLGAPSKRWRHVAYVTATLCLVGVVASLARGAVLVCAAMLFIVWWRSPRKLATSAAAIVGAGVIAGAIQLVHPSGAFWEEMATSTEGIESGTGRDRWILWNVGWDVFKAHPVMGAGANCCGVRAAQILPEDPARESYWSPGTLYGRQLHNSYVQILCEEGVVGASLWLIMILDFFRRTRALRRPKLVARWKHHSAEPWDPVCIARGLELAMIGYLGTAVFYDMTYVHWYWTLITLAYVLHQMLLRLGPAPARAAHAAPEPASALAAPAGGGAS